MAQRTDFFIQHFGQTTPYPLLLDISHAKGNFLYTKDGRKILDMVAGVSACSVGHCHPEVVRAIHEQSELSLHTMVYGECIQDPSIDLTRSLIDFLPDSLDSVFYVNSGTEAIEAAMKLAKKITGRSGFISFEGSYHGSTHGALSLMGYNPQRDPYRPLLPDTQWLRWNTLEDLSKISTKTAAVVFEVLQGASGFRTMEKTYMQALHDRCKETGTLLILDEIQTGFGRMGTEFGFQHLPFIPDMLCLAKGMGGGMPIGALVSSKEHMLHFIDPPLGHINTFGGNPVCCAASLATWKIVSNPQFLEEVAQKENYFKQHIRSLPHICPQGTGLAWALFVDTPERCQALFQALLKRNILMFFFLFEKNALRFSPPLTISYAELDLFFEGLAEAVNEVYS